MYRILNLKIEQIHDFEKFGDEKQQRPPESLINTTTGIPGQFLEFLTYGCL